MGNGHKRVAVQREPSALAKQRQRRRSSGSAAIRANMPMGGQSSIRREFFPLRDEPLVL